MKILAIRGRNLASLAGNFEVAFDAPPLDGAGVFAITGPTGAGKSSLLDALCLALFDQTPRLSSRGGVLVGREDEDEKAKLGAGDVRNLLRRGAGEGFAEVEFVGRDGHRYRARWSVRRARLRADGRMQQQTMALEEVDTGRSLSGTKSETLEAIRDRLGLSFDQFRRSALLAQGDFAAFLKAASGDRADLLERMTGTAIYGRLSQAAFERAKREREALGVLAQRRADTRALDDEARAAAVARLAEAAAQAQRAAARAELAARIADRSRAAAAARAAHAEAAIEGGVAVASEGEATCAVTAAEARAAATCEAMERARPALDETARLDAELAQAEREAVRAGDEREQAAQAARAARDAATELEARVALAEAAEAEARAWLEARADTAAVAAEWGRWCGELERYAAAAGRRAELDAERAGRADRVVEASRSLRAAETGEAEARRMFEVAAQAARAAEVAAAASDPDEAREALRALEERLDRLRELRVAVDEARALVATAEAADGERRECRREARRAETERAAAETERAAVSARRAEAEASLSRARAALDLSSHRAELIDGEPCPLCGACAHPWAVRAASAIDALVHEGAVRVAALADQGEQLARREADASARAAAATRHAVRAGDARDAARDRLASACAAWTDLVAVEPALPADVAHPDTEPALAAVFGQIARARDEADEAERRASALAQARSQAAERREAAKDTWIGAKDAAVEAARAVEVARVELERCDDRAVAARDAADGALAQLEPAFAARGGGWRDELAASPEAFARARQVEVEAFRERTAARERSARDASDAARGLDGARARLAERADSAARAAQVASEREAGRARLAQRRGALLGGRLTAAVRDELEAAIAAARAAHDGARASRERACARAAGAAARASELGMALAEREREHAAAVAETDGPVPAADVARAAAEAAKETHGEAAFVVRRDDEARAVAATLGDDIAAQQQAVDLWAGLSELIGSADGKKFRVFAQSLTLDALIEHANRQLEELAPRYRLQRVPNYDLELQVIDGDMGDEVRSVDSLSGGETFLVSLALALALSSLSSRDTQVESLLIDEGFGTLDEATMDIALSTLEALQATGRKVGLIPHVAGLADRIGVQVRVRPRGGGRSDVSVSAG